MKIKIITFQYTANCGACLQAYALSNFLRRQGHNVEIADYRPDAIREVQYLRNSLKWNLSAKAIVLLPFHLVERMKFHHFMKDYCTLTPVVYSAQEIAKMKDTDLFITGSDQVWNPDITGGLDDGYFLNFKTDAQKMSYAASMGNDSISDDTASRIAKIISDYKRISVREDILYNKLKQVGVHNVQHVVDPVFLLDQQDYRNIMRSNKRENYVLIYEKHRAIETRVVAKRVADKYNLKILDMSGLIKRKPADYHEAGYAPREFLGLFANASFVITNSFHGTAFSIIFRKNFYSLPAQNRTSRIASILNNFGFDNRLIFDAHHFNQIEPIEYVLFEKRICERIEQSKRYLQNLQD